MNSVPQLPAKVRPYLIEKLEFPLLWAAKPMGKRVFCHPTAGPLLGDKRVIPNENLREWFSQPELFGFDGIAIFKNYGPDHWSVDRKTRAVFKRIKGPILCHEENATFMVFDDFSDPDLPFEERYKALCKRIKELPGRFSGLVIPANYYRVNTLLEMINVEHVLRADTYKGLYLKPPESKYLFGRVKFNQKSTMYYRSGLK
jgi:hypothetical protein